MSSNSQEFIGRNRPPRVQIEYQEGYESEKKVDLPHINLALAGLSGKPKEALPPVEKRKAKEIDVDNFDERLRGETPRVAFQVPNRISDAGGNLSIDVTFEAMEDFSPAAIARKVEPLRKLLEARTQLKNLLTHMDGKTSAEELLTKALKDPALLQSLISAPKAESQQNTNEGEE